mgnify:CR=1 FL=1
MKKITILGISCALSGAFSATSGAEEALPALAKQVLAKFPKADRNSDGKITGPEWTFVQKGLLRKYPIADTEPERLAELIKIWAKTNSEMSEPLF